jgi:hypothetical protein
MNSASGAVAVGRDRLLSAVDSTGERNQPRAAVTQATLLVAEYEKWMREAFPSNWRQAFEFVGLTVPLDGDKKQPWDMSFDCLRDPGGHMFTCYFEGGKPSHVTIDG